VGLTQNQGPYLINEIAIGFKNIIFWWRGLGLPIVMDCLSYRLQSLNMIHFVTLH
jgi:hypothetical protein